MEMVGYGEFSQAIHGRCANGQRALLDVSIELTNRCPLQCAHCYNNLPLGDKDGRLRELSKEEHFRILDELAELGCLWLLYTGGEIFARPDFLEIYTYAKRKGFLITLFTNGTLITDKVADYLLEWPPFSIEVTMYGLSREVYEAVTGVTGSHARFLRGIEALRRRGLPLKLKTVANSINSDEVLGMKRFAEEELHVEFKFDAVLNPRIDSSKAPLQFRLSPEEVVAFDLQSPGVPDEYRKLAQENIEAPAVPDKRLYACGGGKYSFAIDPYGQASLCALSHGDTYDLRGGSLKEAWEQFIGGLRQKNLTRATRCQSCRIRALCNMCPAFGELENGDAENVVEFLCEVAHLRAMSLGCEVPRHGACPYCAGGEKHAALRHSAEGLTNQRLESLPPPGTPVVNECGTKIREGCSSCK
jgi:radical SAM protein with 4Fe4S-binding SPASM domain